ncbi:MAG: extracellular solute-binding protein [Mycobacteriales bacterium]
MADVVGRRVAAGCVLALAAAGCGAGSARPPAAPADGTITLVTGVDLSQGGIRGQLIGLWNRQHPDHPVRIVELPSSADLQRSQMLAAEQSGNTSYDVLNLDVTATAEFAEDHAIQPLPAGMVPDTDFFDGSRKSVTWHGRSWAVPFNADAGLLYYRKDWLDSIAEGPPSTWDDLKSDYKSLQDAHPELRAAYVTQLREYEGLTVNALEAAQASGESDLSARPSNGLKRLADDIHDGTILNDSLFDDESASVQAFLHGQVAFMRNWPFAYDVLAGAMSPAQFGVWPLPSRTGGQANADRSVLGGQNLAVAAHSRNTHWALGLIKFLTGPGSERCLLERGGLAAARPAVYDDGGGTCPLPATGPGAAGPSAESGGTSLFADKPALRTLRTALTRARARPVTPYYPEVSYQIQHTVSAMLNTQDTPSVDRDAAALPKALRRARQGR